jgi:hypothetical protein
MSRIPRRPATNEPAEPTSEPTESTIEPGDSTIEPGLSTNEPKGPTRRLRASACLQAGEGTRKAGFAEGTRAP